MGQIIGRVDPVIQVPQEEYDAECQDEAKLGAEQNVQAGAWPNLA